MLDKFIEIFQGLDIAYGEYFLEGSLYKMDQPRKLYNKNKITWVKSVVPINKILPFFNSKALEIIYLPFKRSY